MTVGHYSMFHVFKKNNNKNNKMYNNFFLYLNKLKNIFYLMFTLRDTETNISAFF